MPTYYPAFLDLTGRACVVIGAGEVAERKVGTLLKCGARVTVISPDGTAQIAQWAQQGAIDWRRRIYTPGDLEGAWLAVAATDHPAVNHAIAQEAQERHVLLNVVDQPSLCSFIAPSVVQRGDLTIAMSTGGRSPAMARKVREEMERHFPLEYGDLLELAGAVRDRIMQEHVRPSSEAWQRALSPEVLALLRDGKRREAEDLVIQALKASTPVA